MSGASYTREVQRQLDLLANTTRKYIRRRVRQHTAMTCDEKAEPFMDLSDSRRTYAYEILNDQESALIQEVRSDSVMVAYPAGYDPEEMEVPLRDMDVPQLISLLEIIEMHMIDLGELDKPTWLPCEKCVDGRVYRLEGGVLQYGMSVENGTKFKGMYFETPEDYGKMVYEPHADIEDGVARPVEDCGSYTAGAAQRDWMAVWKETSTKRNNNGEEKK